MRQNRLDSSAARQASSRGADNPTVSTMPKRHGTVWLILAVMVSELAFAFNPPKMDAVDIMDSLNRRGGDQSGCGGHVGSVWLGKCGQPARRAT